MAFQTNYAARSIDDYHLWYVFGDAYMDFPWSSAFAGGSRFESQWLTVRQFPWSAPGRMPHVDLGEHVTSPIGEYRDEDRLTFDLSGNYSTIVNNVEYVDSTLETETHLNHFGHLGFTTDGSFDSLKAFVGNHEMHFTTAIKDSTLDLGAGWDIVSLDDHRDLPGTQYWSLIRRDYNQVDLYSLITGNRIRMEGGAESLIGDAGFRNYGEIEQIIAQVADPSDPAGPTVTFNPGSRTPGNLPNPGDRGLPSNIDLRTFEMVDLGDGYVATPQTFSDSFNLAYFNFIRYTSDNVWVGEATVHNGLTGEDEDYSTPNDRTVTAAKYGVTAATLDEDAYPMLSTVLGTSRNGTHDLIVEEQDSVIAGKLRLYTKNVESELYNEFNDVYLGTSDPDSTFVDGAELYATNGTSSAAATWSDRVALYGFGGNDSLTGGFGRDYIFGGESTYNQLIGSAIGNRVAGGTGADYFGVGNTSSAGVTTGDNRIVVAVASGVTWEYSTDGLTWTAGTTANWANGVAASFTKPVGSFEIRETLSLKALSWFEQGYATDVISDWNAQEDTLVVLSNGTAVIGGLRDGNDTVSLADDNTLDFRDYTAIATSDQGLDGARGGIYSQWDAEADGIETAGNVLVQGYHIETLNDVYTYQGVRDAQAITNEDGEDITVRNQGLLVAKGLEGNDILHDSAGNDYLYGGKGANLISLAEGGADRIFYDTFDGSRSKHYVASFDNASVASPGDDQFYLNKRVIDAFGGNTNRDLISKDVGGVYTQAVKYAPGVNFLHDVFYSPSVLDSNAGHTSSDGQGAVSNDSYGGTGFGGADGTTFGIGVGMFAAGLALQFVPFGAIPGRILMATGTVLGGGGSVLPTVEHRNATYTGAVSNYMNVITGNTSQTNGSTTLASAGATGANNKGFLSFFGGSDAGDGFIPVVEFTAVSEVYGYFALHSENETFVYLVASRDNLVENGEAILIAEINGILYEDDFKIYDGLYDIYNSGSEDPIILLEPTITRIEDSANDVVDSSITPKDLLIDMIQGPIEVDVTISAAPGQGSYLIVYDGAEVIYDGSEIVPVDANVSAVLDGSIYTVSDNRALGTVALQSDRDANDALNPLSDDNTFTLTDSVVKYSIAFVDGTTGMPTRTSYDAFTVTGGATTLNAGEGDDILNITGTSKYLNGAINGQIIGLETIMIAAADTNEDGVVDGDDDGVELNLERQDDGFTIYGSSIDDTIKGSEGNDDIAGFGGQDSIDLSAGGADRVNFVYSNSLLGSDSSYDIITGAADDDEIYVGAATADANSDGVANDPAPGFLDRDGDPTRLMFETATLDAEMAVASATELLVVSNSSVSSAGDVTAAIATALDSAFNLAGLDGNAPSESTGGGSDSSVLYAVRSDTGSYWVGRYEDIGNNDTIDGNTEIEIFANVSATNILDSFWLPTELAPQALTITLPSTVDTGAGELYTQSTTFSVGGLQNGNQVYYSLNGGTSWQKAAVDQTIISLNMNQSNDIRVRQVDGNNYSPETTAGTNSVTPVTVIWDDDSPDTDIGELAFTSLGNYEQSTYNGKPYYINVEFDTSPYETFGGPAARIYFDFYDKADIDSSRWNVVNVVKSVQVHDLSDTLGDYKGGLNDFGAAYIAVDEVGRVTINTNDIDGERTATSGIDPDFRLRVEFDIPLVSGGYQNFIFDGYIDNGINID